MKIAFYIVQLTNTNDIGLSETKLENAVLSNELETKKYDRARFRRGGESEEEKV